jgi:deoxyribodipyrimidine photo-lyase
MILRGKPEEEIPKIVAEYKALKVFLHEVAYEEKETETWFKQPLNCVVN